MLGQPKPIAGVALFCSAPVRVLCVNVCRPVRVPSPAPCVFEQYLLYEYNQSIMNI